MKFQKLTKRVLLFACFILFLVACQGEEKTGEKLGEKIETENSGKDDYVKLTEVFYGPFDTDVEFTLYLEKNRQNESEEIIQDLEEDLWKFHELFDNYENYEMNNIKTINDKAGIEPVEVDPLIIESIERFKEHYEEYGPELNIAMGRVLEIWHDIREKSYDGEEVTLPSEDQLKEAMAHSNMDNIIIEGNTVFLKDPEMRIDLGGIATGFSLEKISENLKEKGLHSFLISAGGDVQVVGKPEEEGKEAWKIGIQNPESMVNEQAEMLVDVVEAVGSSVLTSGSYQRFFEVDGVAYNHIIDPETLYPANLYDSVTVVTKSPEFADYLSTLLFIKDFEEGKELVESLEGVEALWVFTDQTVYKTWDEE